MTNKNSNNLTNCDSCDYCYYCNYCDYCYYCNYCDYCYYCYSCYSCNYCYYCYSCYSCYSCNYCNYCNSCYSCNYCYFSANLKMSEKMIFCLGKGKYESEGEGYQKNLRIFNKDVTEEEYKEVKDALNRKNFKLPLTKMVDGKLQTQSYQDAWAEMWAGMSTKDKNFITSIIHFNADIFKEITGIDVTVKDDKMEEAMELLKKNGYKVVKE